ncbi:MAG: hypothetical protein QOE74_3549 [Mycobacterium sp.]|nr:domain S-box [Mycobacterium sp.]MDT5314529.1 hypothetical protein [Mycobacterium sp.]
MTVLEWMGVPAIAVANDGSVVFANWAFSEMIGYTPEMVRALGFQQIFPEARAGDCAMAVVRAHADLVVDLVHLDGSTVRAKMGEPLVLGDEELALASFDDMTETPWVREL